MGRCKFGPCIGVEHEDYQGKVALEGMTSEEFQNRVFQNIVTEGDLDRVWSSVENAIRLMGEDEDEQIETHAKCFEGLRNKISSAVLKIESSHDETQIVPQTASPDYVP